MSLDFANLSLSSVTSDTLSECAQLFSRHYGVWSPDGRKPGQPVKMSSVRLREQCLSDQSCRLVTVKKDGELAGQAFYRQYRYLPTGRDVVWITQLVIDEESRGQNLARRLLSMACCDKGLFACALVTSHPYAVKALESALHKRCDVVKTAVHAERLIHQSGIDYIQGRSLTVDPSVPRCVIDTDFHVSHEDADRRRARLRDWQLGDLKEGEEFVAIVFPDE